MASGVAINVGANTNEPGVRGPIFADGRFEFVPIPETEPTRAPVPTYADLPISIELPPGTLDRPVHLDPEFAGYGPCEAYTYGDPYGVKARPILELDAGDVLFFYATLTYHGDGEPAAWVSAPWGAYVIGWFRLAEAPVPGDAFPALSPARRARFESNAHCRRASFDAAVLARGEPEASGLLESAIPLSRPDDGATANRLVTACSSDSGRGPWWRRPLRFDDEGVRTLLSLADAGHDDVRAAIE